MTALIPYRGIMPKVHESVYLAEGAKVIGNVEIGPESSVWFNAVIRGDVHAVQIGARTNIQDSAVLHVTHDRRPLQIGSDVTVGHHVILHGCSILDGCLIGMGSIVLDGANVGRMSVIGAGSLVLEGFEVPEGMLVAGSPAKIKRRLSEAEKTRLLQSAQNYIAYARSYRS